MYHCDGQTTLRRKSIDGLRRRDERCAQHGREKHRQYSTRPRGGSAARRRGRSAALRLCGARRGGATALRRGGSAARRLGGVARRARRLGISLFKFV